MAIPLAATFFLAASLTSTLHAQALGTGGGNKSVGRIYFGGDNSARDTGPKSRVLHGRVLDKNGDPVKGALVYLKEGGKAPTIRTIQADDQGIYRFVQLSQNIDYELWAQVEQKKSAPKAISSFDNRQEVILNLNFSDPPKTETEPKPVVAKP